MVERDVEYWDGPVRCVGFLAYDDMDDAQRPGIMVIHEGFGLGDHVRRRAAMLAELGYIAFAIDMHGERRRFETAEAAQASLAELRQDPAAPERRALAGLAQLVAHPLTAPGQVASIGYCLGGSTSLDLARAGAPLRGVVSFHGGFATSRPPAPNAYRAKVLMCNGADDPLLPAELVLRFEQELSAAGADWQLHRYGGAVHGFTNVDNDGSKGDWLRYNANADRRSWLAMQNFLAEIFACPLTCGPGIARRCRSANDRTD